MYGNYSHITCASKILAAVWKVQSIRSPGYAER